MITGYFTFPERFKESIDANIFQLDKGYIEIYSNKDLAIKMKAHCDNYIIKVKIPSHKIKVIHKVIGGYIYLVPCNLGFPTGSELTKSVKI